MSLQTELDTFKTSWRERVGAETAKLVDDDNAALQSLADRALKTGAQFPKRQLPNQIGGTTDLGALIASGPLVVTFYRGGWCPYCNLELRAYQKALPEITALSARLVAISPETPDNTLTTAEKNALSFDVLSDTDGALADALGIRFQLSPAIKALYRKFGHDLPTRNGDGQWSLPMPASYVIERGGRIALASVDPDYRNRMDPAVALSALRKIAIAA
ncbi:peroxiredoxin-like family protein [Bradyrhizobium sp. RDT46]|jgi:peroxiredoxin|uniref:peroxiredoxin-like family protein n=1 Tax=Bradyrhizobium sp. RDT46 TaxID=3341829 RepID=UPI0035C7094E